MKAADKLNLWYERGTVRMATAGVRRTGKALGSAFTMLHDTAGGCTCRAHVSEVRSARISPFPVAAVP